MIKRFLRWRNYFRFWATTGSTENHIDHCFLKEVEGEAFGYTCGQ
jgi:hypothetical protein